MNASEKTTCRLVVCSCCERSLLLWQQGRKFWVDDPPMCVGNAYFWLPKEDPIPPWVETARQEAVARDFLKGKRGGGGALDQKLFVFCPWCYGQFQRSKAARKVFFNPI